MVSVRTINWIITPILLCLCLRELINIAIKVIGLESFQAVNQLQFEELTAPSITLCPGPAWKSSGPFVSLQDFKARKYTWEEIFHPRTLQTLKNESLFSIKETYASYYGVCFTMQKLRPEQISDYSFQFVVKNDIDYIYYLHEPQEENHLFMSVYPYEVPLIYMDANNDDGIGGADIIYKKELVRKIPGKGGCQEIPLETFIQCIRKGMKKSLEESTNNINCKVPAMDFTDFNSSHLKYCNNSEDSLEIEGAIYNIAQDIHKKKTCGSLCDQTIYSSELNFLSERVLAKEIKVYGEGYYIVWAFYSTLYVNENIETYLFDFDSALVAVGGSIGLFLGWSIHSMIMSGFEALYKRFKDRRLGRSLHETQRIIRSV